MSLRDIDQICEAFSGILKGVYHERIEYPKVSQYISDKQNAAAVTADPAPSDKNNPEATPPETAPVSAESEDEENSIKETPEQKNED